MNPESDVVPSELVLDTAAQELLFLSARTANTFSPEPVSEEQVQAIYELVKFGPSSANSQPLRVVLVRSSEARERLLPLMSEGNRPKVESAPLVAIFAADTDFHEHFPQTFPHREGVREAWAGDEQLPRREAFSRFNAALQIGYWIMGIRAAGLAAGPMAGFDADGMAREFFPEGRHRPLLVVNIGRPGENPWFHRLPRLNWEQVVSSI